MNSNIPTKEELAQRRRAMMARFAKDISPQDFILASIHAKLDSIHNLVLRQQHEPGTPGMEEAYNENDKFYQDFLEVWLSFLTGIEPSESPR